jgi:hypothetical protein
LATCSSIPAQGAAATVGVVLAVGDLVSAAGGFLRPDDRPELGEDLPVGEVLAGVLAPPLGGYLGTSGMRVPRMKESQASSTACRLASEIIPPPR